MEIAKAIETERLTKMMIAMMTMVTAMGMGTEMGMATETVKEMVMEMVKESRMVP